MSNEPVAAVCGYLAHFSTINEAVSGAIFRPEIPREEDAPDHFNPKEMPRACIVARYGGGGHMSGKDRLPRYDSIVDIYCYGSTRLQADNIATEVLEAMRELTESTWEETRLWWARIAAGPTPGIDTQETNWPFSLVSCQVLHSVGAISESFTD